MQRTCFNFEVDNLEQDEWIELVAQFNDATLYQTWSYGAMTKSAAKVSHAVLKSGSETLACCQVNIRTFPLLNIGIADIKWGPLWMKKNATLRQDVFLHMIRELKKEYGIKHHLLVRMWPHGTGSQKQSAYSTLSAEGFKRNAAAGAYRTLHLDLSPSLEELRQNLSQRWRRQLKKAENNGLSLVEGTSNDLYRTFLSLGKEMKERKKFLPGVDYETYGRIQDDLPESLKMKIVVCNAQDEPICASIYSAIGDTGIYLLGATGDKGLGLKGGYLLQWHMIRRLKESGVHYYDLGGIDPQQNPGVYDFKLGIVGKKGCEEELLWEYNGCFSLQSRMARLILNGSRVLR